MTALKEGYTQALHALPLGSGGRGVVLDDEERGIGERVTRSETTAGEKVIAFVKESQPRSANRREAAKILSLKGDETLRNNLARCETRLGCYSELFVPEKDACFLKGNPAGHLF